VGWRSCDCVFWFGNYAEPERTVWKLYVNLKYICVYVKADFIFPPMSVQCYRGQKELLR
jgi:hypothetical protein